MCLFAALQIILPNATENGSYVSPAALGEAGMAAFHEFIMAHDNFSIAAAHASTVVARKSNRLPINDTSDHDLRNSTHTNSTDSEEEEAAVGPLMINISDGSRWFLPVLKPLPVMDNRGARGSLSFGMGLGL